MGSQSLAALLFCGRIYTQGIRSASVRGLVSYSLTGLEPSHLRSIPASEPLHGSSERGHLFRPL